MEIETLKRGQGMQEHHQISMSEMMKGKLDENNQYDYQTGQVPTQPLVNPKNLCSMDRNMPSFSNDHDAIESDIPPNDDENMGREDINVISKLRSSKNLSNPYESRIDKYPKKGVDDDLDGEKALDSYKELDRASLNHKDYTPHPFLS